MLVIDIRDNLINPRHIMTVTKKFIKGSNPYCELEMTFVDGRSRYLRYELDETSRMEEDYMEFKNKISDCNILLTKSN